MTLDLSYSLLSAEGVDVMPSMEDQFRRYLDLIEEWNAFAGLVSPHDLPRLQEAHLQDALSLVGLVRRYTEGGDGVYLDVGSGGGFPAIPLKVVLPGLSTVLVERSQRKVGFLRKVIGALRLEGVDVLSGEFPAVLRGRAVFPRVMTARAVEQPPRFLKALATYLPAGCTFLCQFGDPSPHLPEGMFHVEPWEDAWTVAQVRRGTLHCVRRG